MVEFENTLTITIAIIVAALILLGSALSWYRGGAYRKAIWPAMPEFRISWLDFSLSIWALFFLFVALSMIAQKWLLPPGALDQMHHVGDLSWRVIFYGFVIQITFVVILLGIKISFALDFLPDRNLEGTRSTAASLMAGAEMLLRYFPLLWVVSFAWVEILKWVGADLSMQEAVSLLVQVEHPAKLAVVILTSILIAPILEELLFRGFILRVLSDKMTFWVANTLTSAFFAVMHFNLPSLFPIFTLSFLLGLLVRRTGDIRTAISMHACFNSYSVIFILIERYSG
jgi:membrane protease YdiL (CAAX protease family)